MLTRELMEILKNVQDNLRINTRSMEFSYAMASGESFGCHGSSCSGSCDNGCEGDCYGDCYGSCTGDCSGSCSGECTTDCSDSCSGSLEDF
jgi:hypothetical protein